MPDVDRERGIIFTTFHYGNFEWTALVLGLRKLPGLTLTQEFKNPLLEPIFAKLRRHSGNELAPRARGIVRMYKALQRGQLCRGSDRSHPQALGSERGNRLFRNEEMRHLCSRLAASAHRCADHPSVVRAAEEGTVSSSHFTQASI